MRKHRVIVVGLLLIFSAVGIYLLYLFNYLPHQQYTNAEFKIVQYQSQVDMDQDGIDDQQDILTSVREYLATRPKYKSKYYGSGYPDDDYGVCTDVVAFGLLGAGYDIQLLLDQDIRLNRMAYEIDEIDKNIDFRRVQNLKVYFDRHAQSLTTDINDIDQWQGGDIVVFKRHIGIVSDKRNYQGITFVIHHASPWQWSYEEDILKLRNDIVGHYRMS